LSAKFNLGYNKLTEFSWENCPQSLDNNVDNLEWCSRSDNVKHALENGLIKTKRVKQLDKNNSILNIFNSVKEASEKTNTEKTNISKVCNNKIKTANGFFWKFC
jgi:hypothetical protein